MSVHLYEAGPLYISCTHIESSHTSKDPLYQHQQGQLQTVISAMYYLEVK
jgi:hypothetical protein